MTTSLLASAVLLAVLHVPYVDECPLACPPVPNVVEYGTPPLGVNIGWAANTPTPGSGVESCATCSACAQFGIVLAVDNNQYEEWCFTYDGGSGPSQPQPKISRQGYLKANCDDQTCFQIVVTTCQNPVTPQGYSKLVCLYCGCE